MSDEPAIRVENLQKTYRSGMLSRRSFQALKSVSLEVRRGEIFGLLGPNGAGKTTFIKILLGIIRKTGGDAELLGHPAGHRAGRIRVGYLPEHLRIPPYHDSRSALSYYGRLSGMSGSEIRQRRDEVLRIVGLPPDRHRDRVKRFSKGMLQRLGLAQALLHQPDLLVLDEPTDGLDPVGRRHVRDLLGRLRSEGKTIFLNSHLLQEVEMVCDRVAILDRGTLRGLGTPAELSGQSKSGLHVKLSLVGPEADIRSALEQPSAQLKPFGNDQFEVETDLDDQPQVDACIDRLRAASVSIVGLQRHRATLEDTFLEMLGNEETVQLEAATPIEAEAVEKPA